jgi:para-aminobenzoate synthetase/4-amino-4-deoxychorismate lyase
MLRSADCFGIPCDPDHLEEMVQKEIGNKCVNKKEIYRLKISLGPKGDLSVELQPLRAAESVPKIFWAAELIGKKLSIIDSDDPTYYHKTTNRNIYDRAWREAEKRGGFDGIFLNKKGEVTEGGRTNLFIRDGDIWQTPPITSGLLPGVMRGILLEDKNMNVREVALTPIDIINAESVYISNSLRGLMKVDSSNLIRGIGILEYSTIEEA